MEYGTFPTDPEAIKQAIKVRRQAIRIMFAEITSLTQALMKHMGPAEFLMFQAEQKEQEEADMLGVVKEHEEPTPEDRSKWELHDYLEHDQEWREYLTKGNKDENG